jgi:hypothetical protein
LQLKIVGGLWRWQETIRIVFMQVGAMGKKTEDKMEFGEIFGVDSIK